jgi:hypothetical protein
LSINSILLIIHLFLLRDSLEQGIADFRKKEVDGLMSEKDKVALAEVEKMVALRFEVAELRAKRDCWRTGLIMICLKRLSVACHPLSFGH